ncbi:zinc finger protein 70-like [Haliotis rubra]|uniref:zinc finger protein 70-like n=1 Tax=Haliotis rubra TaxID=36100 RepID=UPI001EE53CD7|nr:zinc finger protein 70-like [Haliotis rubra]
MDCERVLGERDDVEKQSVTDMLETDDGKICRGTETYKCVECGKDFTRSRYLQRHMKIHSGMKPYQCIVCGKQFSESGNLQRHMRIHSGIQPYQCVECGKGFTESGNLQKHMSIHTGIKPYQCGEYRDCSDQGSGVKHYFNSQATGAG